MEYRELILMEPNICSSQGIIIGNIFSYQLFRPQLIGQGKEGKKQHKAILRHLSGFPVKHNLFEPVVSEIFSFRQKKTLLLYIIGFLEAWLFYTFKSYIIRLISEISSEDYSLTLVMKGDFLNSVKYSLLNFPLK